MKRAGLLIVSVLVAAGPSATPIHSQAPAAQEARLLRFPAIHGNQVVSTYAGDLFTGPNNIVIGWKNANHIRFRSRRTEWKVYFASDRDARGRMNLYSYDLDLLKKSPVKMPPPPPYPIKK